MELFLETGYTSLNKKSEELCGDKVEVIKNDEYMTIVLSDGLGSGVKANILATLTSKILCTMVSNNIPMEECVETILQSLPVCKTRELAYSTFSVIHVNKNGKGYMFEFDNPQAMYIHNGKCMDLEREQLEILGKTIYKTDLELEVSDVILLMSDGTIHAGIGKTLNFGWQRKEIKEYLEKNIEKDMSSRAMACILAAACNGLYLGEPGDDTTIAGIKLREKLNIDIMVGPPIDKEQDDFYISQFMNKNGKKVVCGGTSSKIVARVLDKDLKTSFDFPDKEVPPIGYIDGIDLVTEGVITLRKLLELSEKYLSISSIEPKKHVKKDGASLLANVLFEEATDIHFFVGQGVNVAHNELPIDITMKLKLVENISKNLELMGKEVTIQYN